jgi:hypothetical protein
MLSAAVTLVLALAAQDSARPAAAAPPGAYADGGAADIVARARAARQRNERLVTSYTATVSQRMGVGIHALSRDRMLFHQELLARIEWRRDAPSRIEVQGARQAVPVASRGDQIPEDLQSSVRWLVINPAEDYLRVVGADSNGFVYPLRAGGEEDYRFTSGDTTTITLPSGHTVRLVELKVLPRRSDFRLMSGSLWFDADSYGLVRTVFRPARPFDLRRDGDRDDRSDLPSFLNVGAELKYVTLEYGLYEFRWWMPRYIALDGVFTMGAIAGLPFRYERVYSDYHVQGGSPPPPGSTFRPAGSVRDPTRARAARATRDSVRARADSLRAMGAAPDSLRADSLVARLAADSATRQTRIDSVRQARRECFQRERDSLKVRQRQARQRGARVQVNVRTGSACFRNPGDSALVVVVPEDTLSLLQNPQLGPPILGMGDVISQSELSQLGREIRDLPQQPWQFHPTLPRGVMDLLGRLRYNRVEALSVGLGGELDFGRLRADGLFRIGLADLAPGFELGLTRPTTNARFRAGVYRRLAAANPEVHPLGLGNSLSSFFAQYDNGEYFRTLGAEATGDAASGWYGWRVYGERQRSASVGTEVSLPHLFSGLNLFRANITAQDAEQFGASLAVHGARTVSRHLTVGAEARADGATGTFRYGRGALTLRATVAPPGPLTFGLEAAAGSSVGTVPVQSAFFIGGTPTLRGYDSGILVGDAFWRGRVEAGTQRPVVRLALFTDVGWAGSRATFSRGRALWSAGVGLSFFDGLVRMDLARALSAPTGWRFVLYWDGVL